MATLETSTPRVEKSGEIKKAASANPKSVSGGVQQKVLRTANHSVLGDGAYDSWVVGDILQWYLHGHLD